MPNIRFIDSGTPVGAYGIPKVDNATSSSFATSASFASTAITASHALFAVSASVEITKEVSSSHANRADVADSGNGIFSGSFSGSYIGDGSGLTKVFEGTSASSSISTRLTTQETKTIFSGSFSGSYEGNGSGLTNIPASGIIGLNLSQIADGTATASISETNGFIVNTDSKITGSLSLSGSQDIKDGNLTISGSSNYSIIITGSSTQNTANGSEIAIVDTTEHSGNSYSYGPKITLKANPDDSTHGNTTTINAISTVSGGTGTGPRTVINSNRELVYNNTTTGYNGVGLRIRNNTSPANRNTEHVFAMQGSSGGYAHIAKGQMGTGRIFLHGYGFSSIYGMMLKADQDNYLIIGPQTSATDGAEVVRITSTAFKVTGNTEITGDITSITEITASGNISSSATSTSSFGTYLGDGSQLSGITPTAGSSAGRVVFTTTNGEITAESGFEYDSATDQLTVQSLNVTHLTSSFITASTIQTSGSNIFGDDTTDTQTLIGTTKITGSAQVTGSLSITGSSSPLISLPNAPTNAVIISGSNDRTRLLIHDTGNNNSPQYTEGAGILLSGGEGSGVQATLEIAAVGSGNGGGNNEQTFIHSNQQLTIQAADDDAGSNIKFRGSNYGLNFSAATSGVTLSFVTNGGSTVSELNMGNGTYIQANASGTYYKIGRSTTDWLNLSPTKAIFAADVSSSAASTASFGTYLGDGSQLTGIEVGTNLTQSLFVSPSGNNGTAIVGDITKPFQTILGATGSANPGDTIIVYPGTYVENHNLYKDGVNYHFIDGAKVVANSPVEPMWGGGNGQSNNIAASSNFSSSISITGHGEFISTTSNSQASAIFYIRVPSGVIEFKKATKHGLNAGPYQNLAAFGQWNTQDSAGTLTIRGNFENSGSQSSYSSVVGFHDGNINTDIVVRQHGGDGTAVRLWNDNGDVNGTMDVYSEGYGLYTAARTSQLSYLKGRFETLTSNQGSNYALYFGSGYRGSFYVDAEVRGAIFIGPGGAYEGSVHVQGYQEVSDSPGGGAVVISSGHNQLSQKIYGASSNAAFKVTGGHTTFDGQVRLTGYNSKVFDISGGTFYWKGSCAEIGSYPTTRTDPNVVSGGELIIESQFESFSQAANNNEYMFNLSGGTLDIQSKLRNNIDQVNNGIINMTGGYLRMNSAELVHATQTGSFAYAIDLNNQTHSGSILNNCFTNLQPFNSGSFINEITGGGTLFESHKLY